MEPYASTRSLAGFFFLPVSHKETSAWEAATASPSCFWVRPRNSRATCSRSPIKTSLCPGIALLALLLDLPQRLERQRWQINPLGLKRSNVPRLDVERDVVRASQVLGLVHLDQDYVRYLPGGRVRLNRET